MNEINERPVGRSRRALAVFAVASLFALVAMAPSVMAAGAASSGPALMVNINTATPDELQALPGIGASRAAGIVALRKERGRFKTVDELLEVRGIGPAMMEKLRPQLSLSGKTRRPAPQRSE